MNWDVASWSPRSGLRASYCRALLYEWCCGGLRFVSGKCDATASGMRFVGGLLHAQVGEIIARGILDGRAVDQMGHYVTLQCRAAAAAKGARALVVEVLRLKPVVWLPPQARVAIEAQYAGRAFQPHLAHGSPRVCRHVVVEPIAIEKTGCAGPEFENQIARVFARDDRIHAAQARGDGIDLTQEEAERVDPMHGCFHQQEARHSLE